ncbi:urea carboxylase-associated family protein [Jiella endophytica]|uniref:Urea carboxylase-associated family protein n=1 Tax=Jiella endophytica TaxID=2558362 RepID=A0A4Y8RLN8_9HYPH|nr:urea carboxylase-associated family protein [Jiella endophytica]TFF23130.1 urea carboxylase-associated family protein [Jiella endophytica]
MPLMMTTPEAGPLPPETLAEAPFGGFAVVEIATGQLLTVEDPCGDRTAQLYAFSRADMTEFLSPHHTRVFSNSYRLGLGMRLVSNRRRAMMVLGRDRAGGHDLLIPASLPGDLASLPNDTASGHEALRAAVRHAGLNAPKFPDPVNLFLNVGVERDGRLVPAAAPPAPGRSVTCRVVMDMCVVVTNTPSGLGIDTGEGAIRVRVDNRLIP